MQRNKKWILLLGMVCLLTGCGLKNTKESIFDYKTKYVGDNSKVSYIISHQRYLDKGKVKEIEIQSDSKPYGVVVHLDGTNIKSENLKANGAIDFALISNVSYIIFIKDSQKDGDQVVRMTKEEVISWLEKERLPSLEKIGSSKENLESYMKTTKTLLD